MGGAVHAIEHAINSIEHTINHAVDVIGDLFEEEETIINLSFSKLFPENNNLYKNKFLNASIKYKTTGINPFTQMLYSKINFLNAKHFEKLGMTAKVTGYVYGLSEDIVKAYLEQNRYCLEPTNILYTEESIYLLKYIDITQNNNKYGCLTKTVSEPTSHGTYSETVEAIEINENVYILNTDENGNIINSGYDYEFVKLNVENSESFTGDGNTTDFTLTGSNKIYEIISVTIDDVETDEYSVSNLCLDNTTISFSEPPSDGSSIVVTYEYLDETSTTIETITLENRRNTVSIQYDCNTETNYLYGFINDIQDKLFEQDFLFIPVKHSGSFVNTDNANKVLMREIGVNYDSITESLSNKYIKEAFISLYTTRNNELYNDIFNLLYGTKDSKKTLIISNNNIDIEYYWDDDANKCTMNGYSIELNGNGYLIPIESLKKLPVKTYYDEYVKSAGVITYSEQTVKVKWYQSTFFQFVTLAIAMSVGNPEIVALTFITTQIIMELNISDELKMALIIVTSAYIGYQYGGSTYKFDVSTVSQISVDLGKYYFNNRINNIANKIEEIKDEQKELEEEIQKLKKYLLYFPIDATNAYYDTQFNLLYEFNDLYYNAINEINYKDKNII